MLGFTYLMQVLVFYHQYKVNKAYNGIGWWLLWSAAGVIAFGAMFLRNIPSIDPLIIVIQNFMVVGGTLFLYVGIKQFFNRKVNTKLLFSISALFATGFLYFLFINNSINTRSAFTSSILAIIAFLTAFSLFYDKTTNIRASANFNALVFLVHGCFFVYRAAMIISGTPVGYFFESELFNILPYFDALIASLLWTFGSIIMLNQRLNSEMLEFKNELKLVFNTNPDAAMITRLDDGFIVDINDGFVSLTGFTRQEILGKFTSKINLWINVDDRIKVVNQLKTQGFCENFQTQLLRKDGTEITGLISAKIIDLHGIPHILSFTRNITNNKQLESELKESEFRFQLLFENMVEGVALHELVYNEAGKPIDFRILDVNPAFEKHTTISPQIARGALATELYGTAVPPYFDEYLQVVNTRKTVVFETYFEQLNKHFSISVLATKPCCFATIFQDITDRRKKEEEIKLLLETSEQSRADLLSILEDQMQAQALLSKSEERYRSLLTNLEAGVVVHAPDTKIIMHNQRASILLGLTDDQLTGKTAFDDQWKFINENNEPFSIEEYPVNRIIATKKPFSNLFLGVVRPATNDMVWLIVNGFPVFDNKGELNEVLISFIEITERIKAEEKLKESEKVFSEMFHKSPVTILLSVPFEGTIIDVNDSFTREMQYTREEVIGHTTMELGLFDNPNERETLVSIIKEKGKVFGYECKFRTKNGEIMVGLLSISFVKLGGKICQLSTVIDITERKITEKALLESEEKFRKAFITNPDSITITRYDDGMYVSVNNGFTQILGYSEEDVMGKTSLGINMWHVPEERKKFTLKLKTNGIVENFEAKFNSKDGKKIDCLVSATLIDLAGVKHILSNTRDISERKLAATALANSEIRYRTLFESAKDGILILDSDTGKIVDVNPFLIDLLGYTENQFLEKEIWKIGFFKDVAANKAKFLELKLKEYVRYENLPMETAHGKKINVEFVSNVYLVNNKRVIQCNVRDITERKKAEEEIRNQLDELRRWYAVTLGRESRIMELKQEVNRLLKQIGNPLRYDSTLNDEPNVN